MKTMLLIFAAILGLSAVALAQHAEVVVLKSGQQKSAAKGEVLLKFVSVSDDSRCPTDTNCVWAGNAVVHVRIANGHGGGAKMAVMNTTAGPKGDQFNGWAIYLTSLTPEPKSGKKIAQKSYIATFEVRRLTR